MDALSLMHGNGMDSEMNWKILYALRMIKQNKIQWQIYNIVGLC